MGSSKQSAFHSQTTNRLQTNRSKQTAANKPFYSLSTTVHQSLSLVTERKSRHISQHEAEVQSQARQETTGQKEI